MRKERLHTENQERFNLHDLCVTHTVSEDRRMLQVRPWKSSAWEVAVVSGLGISSGGLDGGSTTISALVFLGVVSLPQTMGWGLAYWDCPASRQIYLDPSGMFSLYLSLKSTFSKCSP